MINQQITRHINLLN